MLPAYPLSLILQPLLPPPEVVLPLLSCLASLFLLLPLLVLLLPGCLPGLFLRFRLLFYASSPYK